MRNRKPKLRLLEETQKNDSLGKNIAVLIATLCVIGIMTVLFATGKLDWRSVSNTVKTRVTGNTSTIESSIQIESGRNKLFSTYSSSILCVGGEGIWEYDSKGKAIWNYQVALNEPLLHTNGKHILLADTVGKKIYAFSNKRLEWSSEVEGEILSASINEKGYVGVVFKGNSSKFIAKVFDNNGKERMSRYYSNNYPLDIKISSDNKSIAISEADATGINPSAGVRLIPMGSKEDTGFFEENSLPGAIEFNGKELLFALDNKILIVKTDGEKKVIKDFKAERITAISLKSKKYIAVAERSDSLIHAANNVKIMNKNGKEIGAFEAPNRIVSIDSQKDLVAVNMGNKVVFINSAGKQIGQFNPKKDVKEVKIFEGGIYAGIIYPDRIDIINIF